jgi:hypothetical protein
MFKSLPLLIFLSSQYFSPTVAGEGGTNWSEIGLQSRNLLFIADSGNKK